MKRFALIPILLVAILLLHGCDDNEPDYGDYRLAFVTYSGAESGGAQYILQGRDDQPAQTLLSDAATPSGIEDGDRCLLRYTELADLGGGVKKIRTDYVSPIIYDVARSASRDDMALLPDTPISVTSIWRSATLINLNGWLPYTGKSFQLLFVADDSTLDSPVVEARIVYNVMGEQTLFDRRVYASFDVANIWNRPTLRTLRVSVGDATFDFTKEQ